PPFSYELSADGAWVVFSSPATDLVAGVTEANTGPDVFLFERAIGTITLLSHAAGAPLRTGNDESTVPLLSVDGRWIGFESEATDLVAGQIDTADTFDVFLLDRESGSLRLVSHKASSVTAAGGTTMLLSADGNRVAFDSLAPDVVAGQIDT